MRQTALWTQTGKSGNRGIPDPLTLHVPRESSGKPGRGTGSAGDCAESREQPGATGQRKRRIDQICSNPEACE